MMAVAWLNEKHKWHPYWTTYHVFSIAEDATADQIKEYVLHNKSICGFLPKAPGLTRMKAMKPEAVPKLCINCQNMMIEIRQWIPAKESE